MASCGLVLCVRQYRCWEIDSMNKEFKKFDMKAPPIRQRQWLRPITWALSFPFTMAQKTKIIKKNCEGLKPPYLLICNHNAFFDFMVATHAIFPHRANYVVAIDGFFGFPLKKWLLRNVGGICKRKFTTDLVLIRQIKRVLANGDVLILYPEARYSDCGTPSELPESLGQMCKMMKVPVVTLNCKGHHLKTPVWNLKDRKIPYTEAYLTQLYTADQLKDASAEEINAKLTEALTYNDFAWQKENNIKITVPYRAEGLHNVLYQCAHCHTEYEMSSKGDTLTCGHCGKSWRMTELGELVANEGETEFSHIPDWYGWQRANVRKEVREGRYYFESECHVRSMPNGTRFYDIGNGTLVHDMEGFRLKGSGKYGDFEMERKAAGLEACHIEYNYLGKYGDCIDLNTLEDTYYIYPHAEKFSVTKINFATEEMYRMIRESIPKHARKGAQKCPQP